MKFQAALISVFLILASSAWAEEHRFEAVLEEASVSPGNPVYLNLTFYGRQDTPKPEVPELEGLRIKYVGPATQISVVNGKVSQSITHSYLVLPRKEGEYKIGPFFVGVGGKIFSASPVTLIVGGVQSAGQGVLGKSRGMAGVPVPIPVSKGSGYDASSVYRGDKVFFVMEVPDNEVYINEALPLSLKLYVDNMGLKDISFPEFKYEGFSAAKWEEPEKRQEVYRGKLYNVLVFKRTIFGVKEGDYTLGPAGLSCKVVSRKETQRPSSFFQSGFGGNDFFKDIFSQYDTYPIEVESNSLDISVLPFPSKGKPSDFRGAVGDFDMEVHVDNKVVKVGDPITVRIIISGAGNLDTVTAPEIKAEEGFKSYEPQLTRKENQKIYEKILIPKNDKVKEVPAVSFSFFNPRSDKYETITENPVPISVTDRTDAEKAVKVISFGGREEVIYPEEKLGRDIVHIKEGIGEIKRKGVFLYNNPLYVSAHIVPAAFLAMLLFFVRRRERIRQDSRYAKLLRAPAGAKKGIKTAAARLRKNDISGFYDAAFKTLQNYLSNKLDLASGNITLGDIELRLSGRVKGNGVIDMIKEVFADCDMARYASTLPESGAAEKSLDKVKEIIDRMERIKV